MPISTRRIRSSALRCDMLRTLPERRPDPVSPHSDFQIGTAACLFQQSASQKSTLCSPARVKYSYVVDPPFVVRLSQRCNVTNDSPDLGFWQQFKEFHCSDCGSNVGSPSPPSTFTHPYLLPSPLYQPSPSPHSSR